MSVWQLPYHGVPAGVIRRAKSGHRTPASAIDTALATSQVRHFIPILEGTWTVAKSELGTKRICPETGRKFYDLNKSPVISPYTGSVVPVIAPAVRHRAEARAAAQAPKEEMVLPETQEAEFVSLEDADAEAQGKKTDAEVVEGGDEIELEDETIDDDATFIEEQEEGDDDVTDIIGDVADEEEP
jgi:uncharacterized protein (TIGR02300 family)